MLRLLERATLWFFGPALEETQGKNWYGDTTIYLVRSLLPKWAGGMAVGNNIYISARYFADLDEVFEYHEDLLDHEFAHVLQWRRYGAWGFLFRYYGEYLILLAKYRDAKEVHKHHSMEIEADIYVNGN